MHPRIKALSLMVDVIKGAGGMAVPASRALSGVALDASTDLAGVGASTSLAGLSCAVFRSATISLASLQSR